MLELLNTFSIRQIIVFISLAFAAGMAATKVSEWIKGLYDKKFNKDYNRIIKEKDFEKYKEECETRYQEINDNYSVLTEKIQELTNIMNTRVDALDKQLHRLTKSDMHDIKSWIVEKHHELMAQQWVDDFTMDTLEKRYSDYVAENGNSYIGALMNDLRNLPHFPQK